MVNATPQPQPAAAEHPSRLSLSRVLELVLQKSPRDHSSVTLTRNAKGITQIEVVVRTGDGDACTTPDEAMAKAIELYDQARGLYPFQEEPAGGESS